VVRPAQQCPVEAIASVLRLDRSIRETNKNDRPACGDASFGHLLNRADPVRIEPTRFRTRKDGRSGLHCPSFPPDQRRRTDVVEAHGE
jgi:hypothetical protein